MNERVKKLREQTIRTRPYITAERAVLVTEFYESNMARELSEPVRRALALRHVLENKKIYVGEGELIVGERGPVP